MAKLRVHELAKELGITSKELLAHLKEAGEFVKAASSALEAPVIRSVREHYAAQAPKTDEAPAKKPAGKKAEKPAEKPAEKSAEKSTEKTTETVAEKPAEKRL